MKIQKGHIALGFVIALFFLYISRLPYAAYTPYHKLSSSASVILDSINEKRAENGLRPLEADDRMKATTDYVAHRLLENYDEAMQSNHLRTDSGVTDPNAYGDSTVMLRAVNANKVAEQSSSYDYLTKNDLYSQVWISTESDDKGVYAAVSVR